jgi:hypothetical protein
MHLDPTWVGKSKCKPIASILPDFFNFETRILEETLYRVACKFLSIFGVNCFMFREMNADVSVRNDYRLVACTLKMHLDA